VDSPSGLRFSTKPSYEIHSIQNQLLLWAALLFVMDVAVRKIRLRRMSFRLTTDATAPATHLTQLKIRKRSLHPEPVVVPTFLESSPEAKSEHDVMEKQAEPPDRESSEYLKRLKDAKKRRS
jgi:hypothetical protein